MEKKQKKSIMKPAVNRSETEDKTAGKKQQGNKRETPVNRREADGKQKGNSREKIG